MGVDWSGLEKVRDLLDCGFGCESSICSSSFGSVLYSSTFIHRLMVSDNPHNYILSTTTMTTCKESNESFLYS